MTYKNQAQSKDGKKGFRSDINGLRAWAVLSVVLYHFNVPGIQGGFVGVDIFFVISGLLMTGIIINGLSNTTGTKFSIFEFYLARARRIIPALAVLCAILLIVGWFILPPEAYGQLGSHVNSAIKFKSNIVFNQEAGYFDTASHSKWLLHTWSLSVEWQFYILFPLFLIALKKIFSSRHATSIGIAIGFAISLALSISLTKHKPSAAFYLLPFRAWEMLAGSLIFIFHLQGKLSSTQKPYIEALGFTLILASIFFIEPGMTWPGWLATIPVTGASLVLLAAREKSFWTRSKITQSLGDASYSIYLWHWPVVVFINYFDLYDDNYLRFYGIPISIILGYTSYFIIEKHSRNLLQNLNWKLGIAAAVAMGLAVGVPSKIIEKNKGVRSRFSENTNSIFERARDKNPLMGKCHVGDPTPTPECKYGGKTLGAIVIGDSHGASVVRTLQREMANTDHHVLDWTASGCPTLIGAKPLNASDYCPNFIKMVMKKQATLPGVPIVIMDRLTIYTKGPNEPDRAAEANKPLIYFSSPSQKITPELLNEFKSSLINTACELRKHHPVYIVRPWPELKRNVPTTMGRAAIFDETTRVSISLNEYYQRHRFTLDALDEAKQKCGIQVLDPIPYLCHDGQCWGDRNGLPIYYDDDHLNEHGAALLGPMFKTVFQ